MVKIILIAVLLLTGCPEKWLPTAEKGPDLCKCQRANHQLIYCVCPEVICVKEAWYSEMSCVPRRKECPSTISRKSD